ncbi:nicotinate-nucleotide--dimethylbenzimidazole phosphoribosyltransferase [Roseovarius faecimaris]|uniref:Nicotinate-nucleotide--dimethylbenzimidazole phosphoribosyltransferase n=1 Tax=Roseovarius faecimaris TaxID=2494550 RepID=A0A6I6IS71_9RHOB|nr:nicotinate-nucleotide--dimethylbenzimidazole phosphoribosyltransferase [Roseovarius faecimaris]QGX98974.1 nicotinate-nucleotide--dimethylbenzimidazole phosphoribosyltransferase [Roseovarius faecimaris]
MQFASLDDICAALRDLTDVDQKAMAAARARDAVLTKPPGALGRLEEIAIWYCGWRGDARPEVTAPQIIVFAGNHGVTARGVSAFPADVTEQMVLNFQAGGAAVNQLARTVGARMDVHALALDVPTADFTEGPAMNDAEFLQAVQTGWDAVDTQADLLVTGEMGIGNTTSAAAIAHALYGGQSTDWVGRGTGVDESGLALKAAVVAEGLAANPQAEGDGLEALRCLGGRELAAMAGAILRARHLRIPVILDGFICTAAAACLHAANPRALGHAMAGHKSAEGAHQALLERIGKAPLLDLGMRLGEGSGAALAISVVKAALACHSGMATFAEAGVSDG